LIVLLIAVLAGFGLFLRAVRQELDHQYKQRALVISAAAGHMADIQVAMAVGDPDHIVAARAETLRAATGASYIVVLDRNGVRYSHPNATLIGERVSEPVIALDGHSYTGIDNGHLGRSANAKTPLRGPDGRIIGEVSAGILEKHVSAEVWQRLPSLILYTAIALAIGVGASLLLARRLKRQTFGLELHEIAELLQEREAMLHGISDGVITVDPDGRISLVNDEARRMLGLATDALGTNLDQLLPPGRMRDLLTGRIPTSDDQAVLTEDSCLSIARMPVTHQGRSLGAVVTLRDRTELVGLLRELDSIRSLTDAVRAQQHEHANRMHTIAGLLELGRADEAAAYLAEISGTSTALAETLHDRIGNPTVVALLLAKVTIAAERGVVLNVEADASTEGAALDDIAVDGPALVTIIGNLVDNAIDAASGTGGARVTITFFRLDGAVVIEVADSGPGLPAGSDEIFTDGFTTKPPRQGVHRGLGLALVRRLVIRASGTIAVDNRNGAVFQVTLPAKVAVASVGPVR
jgi:two-component system CitB family sensor kinase